MSEHPDRLSPQDEADLAALADGRLDPERRDGVLARVAADPSLAVALERQRAAVAAITAAAAEVSAPVALRARVEELPRAPVAPRRLRWRALVPAAALVCVVVLALLSVFGGGGEDRVGSVLAVASRPAVVAAVDMPGPLLYESVQGVHFPDYAARFDWRAAGVRQDTVDGHYTRTVFYRQGASRIAYTIVAGAALPEPSDGDAVRREGIALRALRRDGRTVVTWRRHGHTCVLSGAGVSEATLLELASWKGRGLVKV